MPKTIGLLGKKIGMTRVYNESGQAIGVTAVELGPCVVLQIKTEGKEGYNALKMGFGAKTEKRMTKPEIGQCKAADKGGFYHIKEFSVIDPSQYQVGQVISIEDMFKIGDLVDVTGVSKGKGFQGVIKRHGFKGGGNSHGSMFHRAPGSIGCSAWPSRVVKGKKMPGHMGTDRVNKKNVTIFDIRSDENVLLVKGSLPGAKQGLLEIYTKLF
ncbi:MAG: 50S ribosomal protein L3 [Proteobacteria bacterium]|nr:50S ribosomal protein L3 [Desulfobulbaceae bacterium]MBU4154426.1 50S ribosomal protein L3 [Pseudomonadota bacterium]MDP2105952.1 50S ribosomal protein L3 [Desulfobulbaceae bacterium]